ncbi:MAG: hypothetical protein H6831_11060 [Planctomycetes bacterium]|nr:hypothetical protein [Planctomycetota bacterium]
MVVLNAASIISGPEKTNAWGQTFTLDLGTPDSTLAISRDNRLPRTAVVVTLAARELMRLSKEGEKLEHIVVVGSEVDPTLHPGFREISENLRALRQKWFPRAKLVLISNAPSIDSAEVRIALGIYDKPVIRFEHGTTKTFSKMTGRKSTELGEMTRFLSTLERLIVRACFVRGDVDNSTESEVRGWIRRLGDLTPKEVQIFSPDAKKRGGPRGITKTRMNEIVEQLSEKVSAPVTVLDSADLDD